MKNRIRRIIAVLLAVVTVLCAAPAAGFAEIDLSGVADWFSTTVQAADEFAEGVLKYIVENGEATITDCDRSISGDFVIPSTLGGYPVTTLGEDAFRECIGLTSIIIHDSVTSIGYWVFYGCKGLTNVTIPNSVTTIGEGAFVGCTALTNITIPDSVTSIGDCAFQDCTSLTKINWNAKNISDACYSFKDVGTAGGGIEVVFGDNVESIPAYIFCEVPSIKSVTIGNSVISIGEKAFSGCTGLTSITIPDSVTNIGWGVFYDCAGLKSVKIGNGVTSIGDFAFAVCTGLTSVTIPESVEGIGEYAFYGCTGLASLIVDSGNKEYHSKNNCIIKTGNKKLAVGCKNSIIPSDGSVTTIGACAFKGCTGLTSITIPESVTSIDWNAFGGCTGLTSVTIGNSVTSINGAFIDCNGLTKINWNAEIVSDVYYGFSNAGTSGDGINLVFGDSVKTIPDYLFYNSYGSDYVIPKIKSVTIGNSVTNVSGWAFRDCINLTSVTIPDSVTSIGEYAFCCTGLTSVTIPDSVISIGDYAFEHCTSLTSITIPDSVTSIGRQTFNGCTGLTSITIPDSVTSIGVYAFDGCTGLKTVYYDGTKEQWNNISIGDYNACLKKAKLICRSKISFNDGEVPGETMISFDPSWFSEDSSVYKHDLAKLTSKFAMLGYARKSELKNALETIGFTVDGNFIDLKTGVMKDGETDTEEAKKRVNYFIAHKKMIINGEETTLVFMGLIGSNHNQWYSNFDPSKISGIHKGFLNASMFISNLDYTGVLDKYFDKYLSGEKNVKLLITGHSRGAATANLVASTLISNHRYASEENIYTYTYATPNVTKVKNTTESRFKRIFNFVNPEDFVTKCMPASWGYKRYGTTFTLPSKTNESASNYSRYYNNMNPVFCRYYKTGVPYQPYFEGEKPVYDVVSKLTSTVKSTDEMYSKKMLSGTGSKSTYEFFQESLCPVVADNGKLELLAGLKNMLMAWIMPSACKTYKTVTEFFLKYEAAGMINEALSKGWLDVDLSANVKAEQLEVWARNGQKNFSHAHIAQTYAAFIDSMTEEEVKQERASYRHTVNCPVDIEVYEKSTGDLVGKIVNNVIDEEVASKENAVVMGVDGDSKSFWLPSNGDYEVKLIGNDDGTMDYTVANIDSDLGEVERVNFFDVEITDGLTMTGDFEPETELDDYSLEYENGETLEPSEKLFGDETTSFDINVSVEGSGAATESMTVSSGDYVALNAVADENGKFIGWYENGEMISNETEISFVAKCNRELTAKFEIVQKEPENPSANCNHICHKTGISAFFYKIARFFWKLFKINKECSCGVAHY